MNICDEHLSEGFPNANFEVEIEKKMGYFVKMYTYKIRMHTAPISLDLEGNRVSAGQTIIVHRARGFVTHEAASEAALKWISENYERK